MVSKRFVAKRLLLLIPVLFGVATVVFAILHLAPGDPARLIAGQRASREQYRAVREALGLNQPLWRQYLQFLADAVRFDFGRSFEQGGFGSPVRDIVGNTLPITIELAVYGQLIGILLGIPLGILSAVKQDTLTDHATRIGALSGISIPIFWSGPLLILAVSTPPLKLFPVSNRIGVAHEPGVDFVRYTGMVTVDTLLSWNLAAFVDAVWHLFLPSLVIGIYSTALISRMMRSSMLEVVRQDYVRTARAKGQGRRITLMKHGFRNALIPVVTIIGIQFGTLLGGAVLTETVFGIRGIGTTLVAAIRNQNYPVVQGTVLTFALLFTLVNLGVDITYGYLDPRIDQ